MENTRSNLSIRYEIVCNRIKYLDEVILSVNLEINKLKEEQKALDTLIELYKDECKIDIQRQEFNNEYRIKTIKTELPPLRCYSTSAKILELLSTGPSSINELQDTLNITRAAIASSIYKLTKDNRIKRISKGIYSSL